MTNDRFPPVRLLVPFLLCLPLAAGALSINLPSIWGGFIGDSAVYVSMADSLAYDFDLQYTRDDLVRITKDWPQGPQGVLLSADDKNPNIIHYAKPLLYPLLTAPLYRIFHVNGILLFNVMCFLLILVCGVFSYPRDEGNESCAIAWTLIFWGLTTVPAYIFNLTPDLFNCALIMIGLAPWARESRKPPSDQRPRFHLLAVAVLTIGAAARPPNAIFLLLPGLSLIETFCQEKRRPLLKKLAALMAPAIVFVMIIALLLGATYALTGSFFSYSGFRKRIIGHLPFETNAYHFLNTGNEISTRSTKFVFHWNTLFLNIGYFFYGRFSGLIPYFFPAAVAMLLSNPFRPKPNLESRGRLGVWIALFILILFHIVYIPNNYNGGSCAIGNRYLISFSPALFFLLKTPPKMKTIIAVGIVTAILSGPIAVNPVHSMAQYQETAKRRTFEIFPPEITLLNSWPVDDSIHTRIPYNGYFMYFVDNNQYGKELDGFWVKGRALATMVMRCWSPASQVELRIRNGGEGGIIQGSIGSARFGCPFQAGEERVLSLQPGRPTISYNLEGNPSYCYTVKISVSGGFIPKFHESLSQDSRFLGCFVQIEPAS